MKKVRIISIILILLILSITLIGCSEKQKSEEELRKEIRAELELEQRKIEELKKEIRAELEAEKSEDEENVEPEADKSGDDKTETSKEQKEEMSPITLSAFMTMSEIKNKLGDSYTFETHEEGGYFNYYSSLKYDGISFTFYHDEKEVSTEAKPDSINITSNKYTYQYDFKIGDPALKAFEYCEKNYKNVIDHHNDVKIFDAFHFTEKNSNGVMEDTGYNVGWSYDNDEQYSSKSEIGEDVKIKGISIFYFID